MDAVVVELYEYLVGYEEPLRDLTWLREVGLVELAIRRLWPRATAGDVLLQLADYADTRGHPDEAERISKYLWSRRASLCEL